MVYLIIIFCLGIAGTEAMGEEYYLLDRSDKPQINQNRAEDTGILVARSKKKRKQKKTSKKRASRQQQVQLPPRLEGRRPISKGKYIAGGIVGTAAGLGIGHGIQSRYFGKGLMFTITEAIGISLMYYGAYNLFTGGFVYYLAGAGVFIGFHVWEIVDVWVHPKKFGDQFWVASNNLMILPTMIPVGGKLNPSLTLAYQFH